MRTTLDSIRTGLLWLATLLLPAAPAIAKPCIGPVTPITIGVVPWLSGQASAAWTRDLGKHLRTEACLEARFGSDGDFIAHFNAAAESRYDLLLEPSHVALLLVERFGYRVLGHQRRDDAGYVLFARSDLHLRSLTQLHGQVVALPDPLALASLAAERTLAQEGIEAKIIYLGRHDRVLAAVASGEAKAGGVQQSVFDAVKDGSVRFRMLATLLPPRTSTGMVLARPGLDAEIFRRAQIAYRSFSIGGTSLMPRIEILSDADAQTNRLAMAPYVEMLAERLRETGVAVPR